MIALMQLPCPDQSKTARWNAIHWIAAPVVVTTFVIFGLAAGCVDGPGAAESLPAADYRDFVVEVQPVLDNLCANSSCHGDAGRPLETFSVGEHRLDVQQLDSTDALSDEELLSNYLSSLAFLVDIETAADSGLLAKPLALEAGGSEHVGGVQFNSVDEAEYRIMLRWAQGALSAPR